MTNEKGVEVFEDNAGQVYLAWETGEGREVWGLGPVTPDMYGTAAEHCAAVVAGDNWVPNEADGQTREDSTEDLTLVGRYVAEGFRDDFEDHTQLSGIGGRLFVHGKAES